MPAPTRKPTGASVTGRKKERRERHAIHSAGGSWIPFTRPGAGTHQPTKHSTARSHKLAPVRQRPEQARASRHVAGAWTTGSCMIWCRFFSAAARLDSVSVRGCPCRHAAPVGRAPPGEAIFCCDASVFREQRRCAGGQTDVARCASFALVSCDACGCISCMHATTFHFQQGRSQAESMLERESVRHTTHRRPHEYGLYTDVLPCRVRPCRTD